MAVNAYDVQVCLWKMLKLSSKTCVTVSINHPYVSSSLLFLLLLYICFPLLFWILIYSLPLVVCVCIVLSISYSLRNDRKYREDGKGDDQKSENYSSKLSASEEDESKKPYARVHSVRRRRAKDIMREDEVLQNNVVEEEEKNAVSSTNFDCDMVDKSALIEEISPKEIREVEVQFSLVNDKAAKETSSPVSPSLKHEKDLNRIGILDILKDEKEVNKVSGNEDDQKHNNVMDVGISDAERNKRLESLIARRRSRKLLSLQVRRSLMNMDRNDQSTGQIASLIIPKITTSYCPSKIGGPFSPGPGSAPSVLIPMRNPFDLPYDPQEEKPDLTGDSFHQEFTSCCNFRDMMFSRHESFSLGPSQPGEIFRNRDYGFSRGSSLGYRFSKPGNESESEFAPIMEQKSYEAFESNINSPDDDQIKEIIQIDENGSPNHSEESDGEDGTRQIPQSDFNSSSSSPSSSEEDPPLFKIDREAVLKSLSSMRRNALLEIENSGEIGDNLSYANSDLENASRLKQQYYADKPMRRHAVSYSIASDMQVEVSEVSSPPLTIEENMSYQNEDVSAYDGELERNSTLSWDGEDLWTGSSRLSEVDDNDSVSVQVNEANGQQDIMEDGSVSRIKKPEDEFVSLNEKHCIQSCRSDADFSNCGGGILQDENEHLDSNSEEMVENQVSIEPDDRVGDEQSSGEASINQVDVDSNDQQVPSFMPIQTSMISPKSVLLPILSLSNFDDIDEVHQSEAQTAETSSSVALQDSTSLMDQSVDDGDAEASQESSEPTIAPAESVNEKMKIQENEDQQNEVAVTSTDHDEEISSRSFNNSTDEAISNDFEAATFNQNALHHSNSLIPLLSIEEEMVNGEFTYDDNTKTSSYEDHSENSALHQETGNDERQINSTISNFFDEKKQVQDCDACGIPSVAVSEPVDGKDNSESCKKLNEAEQFANSQGAILPETISALDNETK